MAPLMDLALMARQEESDCAGCTMRAMMLSDPSGLLSAYTCSRGGPLVFHVSSKRNGKILLKLTLHAKVLFKVKIRAPLLSRRSSQEDGSRPKKKTRKRKKRKKRKQVIVDHFDWSQYLASEIKKIESIASDDSKDGAKTKKKRKRKKKKHKRKDKRKKTTRTSSSRSGKTKKKSTKKKSSRKRNAKKQGSEKKVLVTSSGDSYDLDVRTPTTCNSTPTSSRADEVPFHTKYAYPPELAATPSRSKSHEKRSAAAIRPSDLRSPMSWERRRQELLQSKQGSVKINVISLSNPMVTVHGYLFTGSSETKLEETLKGGAFVYRTSGGRKERKMMLWEKRLTRSKSSLLRASSTETSSTPDSSYASSMSPAAAPETTQDVTYLQFDPRRPDDDDHVVQAHRVVGDVSSTKKVLDTTRLNTLLQIHDLEAFERHDGESDIPSLSNSKSSSLGSARVTGEDDLWSYSGEEEVPTTWLSRLRERWTGSSSHRHWK